ncbi:MAG TPA: TonB-dependent receptor [Phnomibacter sp.]|nr:TonB-dependent receptor [Phnomibacter sp.]
MKKVIALVLSMCVGVMMLYAQSQEVKGKVNSDANQPLEGATVTVKDTKNTTTTNAAGEFTLKVPQAGKVTLVITYTGKKPTTIVAETGKSVTVSMEAETQQLDEVVVLGYQTVKRKDVLASVSSVGQKELKDIPINSAAEALNGRLAGVTAVTAEGSPDADVRIRVRGGMSITGDNSPLYVIDGVQMENALNFISPQDIKTIDVLKDAAATSIYGARGANGVIVITTKGGRTGKLKVSYNGFFGVKTLANKLDVLDPYEFVVYQSERSRGSATDSTNFTKNFGTTWDTLQVYKNVPAVDWQKESMGRTGFQTTQNIGVEGGNKNFTYSGSYTYNKEKAIVLNSDYIRHLMSLKGDYKVTKNLKVGASVRYTHQDVLGAGVSDDKGSSYSRLRNSVKYRPFLSEGQEIDDSDPLADPNVGNGLTLTNPIRLVESEYRNKLTNTFNTTAYLQYTIAKNLTFKSTFGYVAMERRDLQFYDSISPYSIQNGAGNPVSRLDTMKQKTITNSNVLTYAWKDKKSKHNVDVMVGEETYDLRTDNYFNQYRDYENWITPDDAFKNTDQATPYAGYPKQKKTRYTSLSFFGRVAYSYKDKYLASVNVRQDGASKFAPEKRWGTFPSASLAWRVNKEGFMKDVKWINDLKIRGSIGQIGNNRIQDYLYITNFNNDGTYYYGVNNGITYAYYTSTLANSNLKWESTESRNLGFDLTMLKNRVTLNVDVYDNRSKDLLLDVPVASTYGYTSQIQNIGETSNKGLEIQLNGVIMKKPNGFNWSANFNIAFNKNEILKLGPGQEYFFPAASWGVSGQPSDYIEKIGESVGSMYGLVTDGFYQVSDFDYNASTGEYTRKSGVVNCAPIIGVVQPGAIKFKDLDGDGSVDLDHDRQIIGNPTPKFTGGFNQTFSYKRWDASMFLNFAYGGDIYNANKIEFTNAYSNNSNMLAEMKDRWRVVMPDGSTAQYVNSSNKVYGVAPDELSALNANAKIWMPIKTNGAFYPHSWAIEDGSFLRINNITVGYTLPSSSLARLKMSGLRFYATVNNLAVFTNYSGYDPEVSVRSNPLTPNLDYSAYPKSRSFIFGINASF